MAFGKSRREQLGAGQIDDFRNGSMLADQGRENVAKEGVRRTEVP